MSDGWTPPLVDSGDERSESSHSLDLMAALVEPWFNRAACHGLTDLFFVDREDGPSTREAKRVCKGCSVLPQCREYSLTLPYHYPGVYGGWSQKERQKAKTARGHAA